MNEQDHILLQRIVDEAVPLLRAQGKPSYNHQDDACLYRAPDGCKCLIGHLIKDEFYTPDFEGATLYNSDAREALARSLNIEIDEELAIAISSLQRCHDKAVYRPDKFLEEFETRLAEFCDWYDLEIPK